MFVLIGCPIYDRAWILTEWFFHIERQDFPLEDIGFIFEAAPDDDETVNALYAFRDKHPELKHFEVNINTDEQHKAHPEGKRVWTSDHYSVMARLRNRMLDRVTDINPDRFFSLDSDILLENPRTISELVQITSAVDAASPLMYMTKDDMNFPNCMSWCEEDGGRAQRLYPHCYPYGSLFQVDVIMAAVMMTRPVYAMTRYKWHFQGEDLGWADDCAKLGFELYLASYIYTPHIMSRFGLERYRAIGDDRGRKAIEFAQENFTWTDNQGRPIRVSSPGRSRSYQ